MATGTQPDAGQILNSLINSILLIDDNLAIHYANPAAQQLLALMRGEQLSETVTTVRATLDSVAPATRRRTIPSVTHPRLRSDTLEHARLTIANRFDIL